MPIKNRLADMHADITAWRRDIHAHPELLYEVHRTAAMVADKLRDFGCDEVVTGIGKTGVVGVIKGKSDTKGRVIGLRADMDALPMEEQTGVDHASTIDGAMHACGHDGHTAMVLGAAAYLAETRNFDGTVVLIFQPAEEGGNGALAMVEDGMMERWGIQEVYGLHNTPGLPAGEFAIRPGPLLAAADFFEISVQGKGGHAAKPHETIDTTVVASQMVVALQSVVARNVDPVEQAVLSVTSMDTSSHAFNVIPDRATLRGTVRTHSETVQDQIEARMEALVRDLAASFGASASLDYQRGVPVTVNSEEPAAFAADVARQVAGTCHEAPLIMGGEDFSFMLQARPGAFMFVGNGDTAALHHPEYDFNDEIIPAGCSYFAELVEQRMRA